MLAIKGLYDGEKIIPLEKLPKNKKFKLLITFLEEINTDEEVRDFSSQSDAFSFWDNEKENIYQDYLVRDKK